MSDSKVDHEFEQLKKDFAKLSHDVASLAGVLGHAGRDGASQVGTEVQQRLQQGRDQARAAGHEMETQIQAHPFSSVLTAFGVGLALGLLLDRR